MNGPGHQPQRFSVLLTDLYQLTMAYGYWKSAVQEKEAVFHLFFRKNPFQGGFSITADEILGRVESRR